MNASIFTGNDGEVPDRGAEELLYHAKDIAEAYSSSDHDSTHASEAVIATALEVGEEGSSSVEQIQQRMSDAAAQAIALTKLENVQGLFTSTRRPDNNQGNPWAVEPIFSTRGKALAAAEAAQEIGVTPAEVGQALRLGGDSAETHKRDRGIRLSNQSAGNTGGDAETQDAQASATADGMHADHVSANEPGGYVAKEVKGTGKENRIIGGVISECYDENGELRPIARRQLVHVYKCQSLFARQYEDGVPVGWKLLRKTCREMGIEPPSSTYSIWWSLVEAGYLYYTKHQEGVTTRRFRLSDELMAELGRAVEETYDQKTRYDLVSGNKRRGKTKTQLTWDVDNNHSWDEKSQLIYDTLKALRGQRDLVNPKAVEDHLGELKATKGDAQATYKAAKESYFGFLREHCEIEEDEDGEEEWSRPEDDFEKEVQKELDRREELASEAARDFERARSRYDQDLRLWSNIHGQGLEEAKDMPNGIYQYETAYEVQLGSGRFTCLIGLQSASEEMKAAACKGIPDYHNKDISSSQTEALIQEMVEANEIGADLDVSAVTGMPDKEDVAEFFGLGRNAPKRPEHGGKFGAMFHYETFEDAKTTAQGKVIRRIGTDDNDAPNFHKLHSLPFEDGEMAWERAVYNALATMAATAQDWADDEDCKFDDPEKVYQELKDFYEEMTEEIDDWRDWLVDERWTLEGQHGSRYGYFVENPCGLPFSIHDPELANSSGEIDRYDQKAAYATGRLQGLEAAYMHALAIIAHKYDYEFLRNEHDGAIILGTVPDEAREEAEEMSGFHRASLEEKPFNKPNTNTEDHTCDTKQSQERPDQGSATATETPNTGSSDTETAHRNGVNMQAKATRCGSETRPPKTSSTGTGSQSATTASDSKPSTDQPGTKPNGSKTSSDEATGSTSPPSDKELYTEYVKDKRERKRRRERRLDQERERIAGWREDNPIEDLSEEEALRMQGRGQPQN
jgi:hypothetical protein